MSSPELTYRSRAAPSAFSQVGIIEHLSSFIAVLTPTKLHSTCSKPTRALTELPLLLPLPRCPKAGSVGRASSDRATQLSEGEKSSAGGVKTSARWPPATRKAVAEWQCACAPRVRSRAACSLCCAAPYRQSRTAIHLEQHGDASTSNHRLDGQPVGRPERAIVPKPCATCCELLTNGRDRIVSIAAAQPRRGSV